MRTLLFAALALTAFSIPVHAITVSAPSNGAKVTSPFLLTASTQSCASLPAVSMGYSIDDGKAIIEPSSFSALITTVPGSHVLHVKCWGQKTNDQVLLNITVLNATSTDISVATPSSGANLPSPFTLTASAKTCASVPAVSMGYSIDDAKAVIEPTSFSASVTATPGTHVLHIKCWGQQASDQRLMNINVSSAGQASTPWFSVPAGTYSNKQSVSMASATTGSTIFFTTDGTAPSTSSSRYSGPVTIAGSMTLQAVAMASGYGNSGLARASYVITAPKGPSIPSYAIAQKEIQLLPNWRIKHDPGTPGTSTGSMTLVSDPTLSGQTAKFYTKFGNAGGELYSVTYGNDTDSKNFVYDAQVWISADSVISNLEMDNNQVMRNGDTVIYAFQCSGYTNTWEYSSNAGTPTQPVVKWLRSTAPCNPSNWTRNTWHHIEISYSRDDAGNVTYHSVWFDGVESPINQTVNSAFSLGWALGAMVANFQVDGIGTSGSSTLYLDNFTISRW
jgi:Chitobiase/beta-hexosaminidase C-terminal domain